MTPKSRDRMPTTSLWGVAAKWPTRAPKTKLILCPRDPQEYSRISLSLSGRILKEYRNIVSASTCGIYSMGFAKSHSLKCSLHKWAWCGAARKSARLNCINLIHFRLTAGRLRESSCIVIPGVVCELLQFAATQQAGIVNFFVDHTHTQFTEESNTATALTPQTDVTTSLSGTLLQTLPLKGYSLSPRSCPATRSAPSERFGY